MRILRVTGDLYPAFVGGIAIHAHEMSRMQVESGNDVTVCTSIWGGEQEYDSGYEYEVVRFKGITLFRNPLAPRLLYFILHRRESFDIIHAHSHLYFSTVLCALVRRLAPGSPPLVITNHGLISQTAPTWLQKIYLPIIGRWTFNSADKVICYTDVEREQLINLGVHPDKISILNNGVDTEIFTPSNDTPSMKQILWIGKYVRGKGVEYLLNGFNSFLKKYPDYSLLMIGDGPLKNQYLAMIEELDLDKKVVLRDFVENHELPEIYRQSRIFVLPSLEEGVPRTILESMACGTPVACTRLPQLVEIVSGCGTLFSLRDPEALADALAELISQPHTATIMGKIGREKAVHQYSWANTVSKTTQLYAILIDNSSSETHKEQDNNTPNAQLRHSLDK